MIEIKSTNQNGLPCVAHNLSMEVNGQSVPFVELDVQARLRDVVTATVKVDIAGLQMLAELGEVRMTPLQSGQITREDINQIELAVGVGSDYWGDIHEKALAAACFNVLLKRMFAEQKKGS